MKHFKKKKINRVLKLSFYVTANILHECADEPLSCSICLEELQSEHEFISLECGHHYHEPCIGRWIKTQSCDVTCPLCKTNIDVVHLLGNVQNGAPSAYPNVYPGSGMQYSNRHMIPFPM